ncbi:hypothetical protein MQM1_063 [Aeromonas phage vB_AsaP_MQM1]|nr:hypothetical protein MQM1_063 [Aeromonas phage vB_AsaP_MQM1]
MSLAMFIFLAVLTLVGALLAIRKLCSVRVKRVRIMRDIDEAHQEGTLKVLEEKLQTIREPNRDSKE